MSNIQSYNALIDRFKAFASGHYILKAFSHGQINEADLAKFSLYPFMHVVPADVTYDRGTKTFSFQIILADLPRDKEDKTEHQKEVLSDLQRIAEDLIAEITNHRMLFGDLITCQNVSIQPFLEEFHHTLTGWTVSIDLLVPYYWDACSIPAEWNNYFESSIGGTGSILSFADSITQDENGVVTLVNDVANPLPHYYYGTNDEGVRGWYLTTDNVGLTCQTIGTCQTIIDIESAIDLLQTDVTQLQTDVALKANIADISAVGFSNNYLDLDNKPTIPSAQVNSDWNATSGVAQILNKPTIPAGGLPAGGTAGQILTKVDSTDYNATWQENFADWTSVVKHTVKNNGTQTLDKGKAVYITTSNGTNMLVGYASNVSEATSSKTMGLLQSTLTTTGANSTGFVITEGLLGGLNTQGTTAGDPIWLGVDGSLIYGLANKPYAPAHLVFIGIVTKVSAGNGEIFVKVQNGFELKEIHDVDLITTTPVNGNVLGFNGTLWVNKTIAGWLGFTPVTNARTLTINGTAYDLSADRSWTIASNPGTVTSVGVTAGTGISVTGSPITSNGSITVTNSAPDQVVALTAGTGIGVSGTYPNFTITNSSPSSGGTVTNVSALTIGTTGTDLSSTVATGTTTPIITLNVPTASATNRGVLSSTDWNTFNGKQVALVSGTNIKTINSTSLLGSGNITVGTFTLPSLTSGSILFSDGTTIAQNNANFFWDNTNNRLGIGTAIPAYTLDVNGTARLNGLSSINGAGVANTALAVYGNGNGAGNYLFQMFDASAVQRFYLTASGNFRLNGATDTSTTGTDEKWRMVLNFAPTSGTRQHNGIYLTQTINQTGGANGITRGLLIEATLTSAADFRAIENTVGKVCLNTTSGNTMIGTTTDAGYKLDVNGTSRLNGSAQISNINLGVSNNSQLADISGVMELKGYNGFTLKTWTAGWASGANALTITSNGYVGINTGSAVNTSAQVQIDSTTRGFLPPRMTTTQKNAIASPVAGLVVYDTTDNKHYGYNGTTWNAFY